MPAGDGRRPAVGRDDVVLAAVKPAVVPDVLIPLRSQLTPDKLLVSVAAGVTLQQLREWSGTARGIRVMPNTPCLIGQGESAFSAEWMRRTMTLPVWNGRYPELGMPSRSRNRNWTL